MRPNFYAAYYYFTFATGAERMMAV